MTRQTHIRFDWAIKKLLRDKANFDVLEGFLTELLKEEVFIKEILESESNKAHKGDKYNRVDILVKNQKEELILIEVQNEKEDDYFHRMLYGASKLHVEYLSSGQVYGKLKRVYFINIVYFELGQGEDYVYICDGNFRGVHKNDILQLSTKQKEIYRGEQVRDIFTRYYLLKVNNFDDIARDSLDEWIYFLKHSEIKEYFKARGLQEAKEKLRIDNLTPEQRADYEMFQEDERIRQSEVETAQSDGYFKAKEEFIPIIEEERRQKEEERRQKEEERHQKKEAEQKAESERKQKEEAEQKAESERKQKEEAKLFAEESLSKLKRIIILQFKKGLNVSQISENTGLSEEEIFKMLKEGNLI